MAQLLVSVRSADEAVIARANGADIIDVKEPEAGPLGRASVNIWRDVLRSIPPTTPVSVALGELSEWIGPESPEFPEHAWKGLSYRKLGLAGSPPNWREKWRDLRDRLDRSTGPPWVAVAYADWSRAQSPDPESLLRAVLESPGIVGVLIDTWDKTTHTGLGLDWLGWIERVKRSGRFLALAGRIDLELIPTLRFYSPDIVALRGAACIGGDRRASIDPQRVRELSRAVAGLPC